MTKLYAVVLDTMYTNKKKAKNIAEAVGGSVVEVSVDFMSQQDNTKAPKKEKEAKPYRGNIWNIAG